MKGSIYLPAMRDTHYTVYGGAYRDRPEGMFGVKLTAEKMHEHLLCDVLLPIPDFSVPQTEQLIQVLSKTLDAMIAGKVVYAGCGFGQGRTGLFLAALLKLWGDQEPVGTVRQMYFHRAVETPQQERFIASLQFPWWLRMKAVWARAQGLGRRRGSSLTPAWEDARQGYKYRIP